MSAELEKALAAREALHAEIKSKGTPPHADYWHQSLWEADDRVRKAQEGAKLKPELDCYGMTSEVRAACAKLNRGNLAETEDLLRQVCEQYDAAAEEVETLQIGNNALLARIKQQDEETQQMQAENLRAWGGFYQAQAEASALRVQRLADIAEIERLRADAARYAFLRDDKSNSLHLTRNGDHACNYLTAKTWIEECVGEDTFDGVPPEEIQRMKDTDTIWALQIYPNTPVGFNVWNGASLDFVVDAAIKGGE